MPKGQAASYVYSGRRYYHRIGRSGRYRRVKRPLLECVAVVISHPEVMVADPMHGGLWLRSHASVSAVACPRCKSAAGVPCKGAGNWGYVCYTHVDRREKAQRARRAQCASQSAS
jgi:hypothetical protein